MKALSLSVLLLLICGCSMSVDEDGNLSLSTNIKQPDAVNPVTASQPATDKTKQVEQLKARLDKLTNLTAAEFRKIACAISRRDYRSAYDNARHIAVLLARTLATDGGQTHPPADANSDETPARPPVYSNSEDAFNELEDFLND